MSLKIILSRILNKNIHITVVSVKLTTRDHAVHFRFCLLVIHNNTYLYLIFSYKYIKCDN